MHNCHTPSLPQKCSTKQVCNTHYYCNHILFMHTAHYYILITETTATTAPSLIKSTTLFKGASSRLCVPKTQSCMVQESRYFLSWHYQIYFKARLFIYILTFLSSSKYRWTDSKGSSGSSAIWCFPFLGVKSRWIHTLVGKRLNSIQL